MGVFTTREIAIFIYGIILFTYVLIHKKGQAALISVIKAACHIKLVIPFCLVIMFAIVFVWGCTYLPIWDWSYLKDIVFWTLFAGIPMCFNATSRQLEEHYYKHLLFDNLKFTALVEFITGTFTFSFIGEMVLQPVLVFFMILQSSLIKKTEATKKVVDGIIGIAGLIIIGLTVKSIIDAIGEIYFVDILVGLILPIILSIIYLPIAYFFSLYSKYEILFLRMGFKEPDDKKLRHKHRIQVIKCCKFSYKKVCKFLNEYVQKIYIKMEATEFETIIADFKNSN